MYLTVVDDKLQVVATVYYIEVVPLRGRDVLDFVCVAPRADFSSAQHMRFYGEPEVAFSSVTLIEQRELDWVERLVYRDTFFPARSSSLIVVRLRCTRNN